MKKYIQPEIEVKVSHLEMFMQAPSKTLPVNDDTSIDNSDQILTKRSAKSSNTNGNHKNKGPKYKVQRTKHN